MPALGDRIEHLLTAGRTVVAAFGELAGGAGGAGEVVQILALRLVEPERAGECSEYALGRAGEIAAFQSHVVVDRDAGEHRDLFAAQPCDAAVAAVRGESRLLGREPGTARAQELLHLRTNFSHTPRYAARSARDRLCACPSGTPGRNVGVLRCAR